MNASNSPGLLEQLTQFHWEPRFIFKSYVVRRRGQLRRVSKWEVRGEWRQGRDGYETYDGEDYGKEYTGRLA